MDAPALADLGLDDGWLAAARAADPALTLGRVRVSHRGGVEVVSERGVLLTRASGNLQRAARVSELDAPVVGDWVLVRVSSDGAGGTLEHVLPRRTLLSRVAPGTEERGRGPRPQPLCANVDVAWILFPIAREVSGGPPEPLGSTGGIERYAALARDAGVEPRVLLTKADLCHDAEAVAASLAARLRLPVTAASTRDPGAAPFDVSLAPARTLVLLGPSGAGKSTWLNRLMGAEVARTGDVRTRDAKGRHTTSRRELFVLPQGGVVIDAPGLRQIGLVGAIDDDAFEDVAELAAGCRFRDCRHDREPACAVRDAVADGRLAADRVERFRALRHR